MNFQKMSYATEWANLVDQYERPLRAHSDARWGGHYRDQYFRQALGTYKLKCFAERARRSEMAIWGALDPLDALRLYLINKHHWSLDQVKAMVEEEVFLYLLRDELEQMLLDPAEAAPVARALENWETAPEFSRHFAQQTA